MSVSDPEPLTIGDRIRSARKAAGLNQADLAARVGVSQPAVANWESGVHDPRRMMLTRIAETLGVSPDWLASGARSPREADKHPVAAYIRRPLRHTPVIAPTDAVRMLTNPDVDPHTCALDYIPVTSAAEKLFALFVDDEAIDRAFPRDTLIVVDYLDRQPADGAFALFLHEGAPIVRRWRRAPPRLEPESSNPAIRPILLSTQPTIIGCVRFSIRIH